MEYTTARCPMCHRNTDRSPLRKVGTIGVTAGTVVEVPKTKNKGWQHKTPVQAGLPRIMYQCTTCGQVYIVNGELLPTQNPLDEVPLISE